MTLLLTGSAPWCAVGDAVGDGVGVSWVGLRPSWWVMWVIKCLNLIKIGCICNYTYRIGGVPRGRDPHDPPRLETVTHATTPRPPTQSPTQKPGAEGLQLARLIWTRVGVTHMTHNSTCGRMTHMTHAWATAAAAAARHATLWA
jgi:hypothetical protein